MVVGGGRGGEMDGSGGKEDMVRRGDKRREGEEETIEGGRAGERKVKKAWEREGQE